MYTDTVCTRTRVQKSEHAIAQHDLDHNYKYAREGVDIRATVQATTCTVASCSDLLNHHTLLS